MKKLIMAALVVMSMASAVMASDKPANFDALAKAADADFQARFAVLHTYKGDVSSAMLGFDIDQPGKFVSYVHDNGVHEQHGISFTPRQYALMLAGGEGAN